MRIKRGEKRKEKMKEKRKKNEIKRKWEKGTCGMVEESGGKFPLLLINPVKGIRNGEGKRKKGKPRESRA